MMKTKEINLIEKKTNIELEKAVLSALIIEPNTFEKYSDLLNESLFYKHIHKVIFRALHNLWKTNVSIDVITLDAELQRHKYNYLEYILELTQFVSSSANIQTHILYLAELQTKRDFIFRFTKLINLVDKEAYDIFEFREKVFQELEEVFIDKYVAGIEKTPTFYDLVNLVEYDFINISKGKSQGLKSSLSLINRVFGGWQKSDLAIVAGRPGMGKTSFLIQCAVDIARQEIPVGIFSLEMSSVQITARAVTNYTGIPNSSVLRKGLSKEEYQRYLHLKEDLTNLQIYIDETPAISIQNLRIKAKMMKLKYGIEILFIDYLQLMTNSESRNNRENEIGSISRGLKALAKELDIPIIALSQLSRQVENRPDKRPILSDLRDSGSIEQDADEVIFLYRPEYYGINNWNSDYNNDNTANELELIISKNRHGGILSERVKVDMATSRIFNYPLQEY